VVHCGLGMRKNWMLRTHPGLYQKNMYRVGHVTTVTAVQRKTGALIGYTVAQFRCFNPVTTIFKEQQTSENTVGFRRNP
jgi:hypothetical protein